MGGGQAILSAMHTLSKQMAQARIEDIHRDALRARTGPARRSDDRPAARPLASPITLRGAAADDIAAVRRVADLDSSEVPAAPLVLAEVDGEVRAAVSLVSGAVVADPFQHTAMIVELLTAYAAHERESRRTRLRGLIRRALGGRGRRAVRADPRGAGASIARRGHEVVT
jgi:hypothetical protein